MSIRLARDRLYSPDEIIRAAAALHDVPLEALYGRSRIAEAVAARTLACGAMRACRHDMSFPDIARSLGRTRHSFVWNAHQRFVTRQSDSEQHYWLDRVRWTIEQERWQEYRRQQNRLHFQAALNQCAPVGAMAL